MAVWKNRVLIQKPERIKIVLKVELIVLGPLKARMESLSMDLELNVKHYKRNNNMMLGVREVKLAYMNDPIKEDMGINTPSDDMVCDRDEPTPGEKLKSKLRRKKK